MHKTILTGLLLMAMLAQPVAAQPALKGAARVPATGSGEAYPTKPIRIVVPFTPGSVADIMARLIGIRLLEIWGQQVLVDNRPGAGGAIAGAIVASAVPDGHTLMVTSSAFTASAAFFPKLAYDSIRDFSGVTPLVSNGLVLVVPPALGVKSVEELIALARQKPGQINFASSGMGSSTHFAGELFKSAAKINVVHVPYRGTPEALNDTISARTHFYLASVVVAIPQIREGRLLGLAVSTTQRAPLLPDVPTLSEAGLPGFEYDGWIGMLAPSATPRRIVDRVSREVARILDRPDVKERITGLGGRPKSSTPEEFDKFIRSEIETRSQLMKSSGIKPE